MLYNKNLKRTKTAVDCISCEHFDSTTKQCNGLNVTCFEIKAESLDDTQRMLAELAELKDKVNQLIEVVNKHSDDIAHLFNAVEQGEF
nr:MAG TPA: hypothetical protein [Caudoviricetes sp.]